MTESILDPGTPYWYYKVKHDGRWHEVSTKTKNSKEARQIRRDELELPELVHGTGIEIVDIARGHSRMLRDWVIEQQRQRLTQVLELVRRNRYH